MINNKQTILIVDDEPKSLALLTNHLNLWGFDLMIARSGQSGLRKATGGEGEKPDLILLDVCMPVMDGFEVCRQLKSNPTTAEIPVIFLTANNDEANKVRGFETGAVDYITKPFHPKEVFARINCHLELRALQKQLEVRNAQLENEIIERNKAEAKQKELKAERESLQEEIRQEHNYQNIIGQSNVIKYVIQQIKNIAHTTLAVLVLGETGTGKELVARAIHNLSLRENRALFKINCAALPVNLIESELFGHEKGAFSGAYNRRLGRFEVADGSTLFLDEIGELPLELQAKLLRVLQDGEFERLGSNRTIKVDVRIIAATNRNLENEVAIGRFRQDLLYRLNVFPIIVPPLRERIDDIPLIAYFYLKESSRRLGKNVELIPQNVMSDLQNYQWPGNIRELQNVIERAVINSSGIELYVADEFIRSSSSSITVSNDSRKIRKTLEEIERDYIVYILEQTGWKVSGQNSAAEILGIERGTLRSRMDKLGIKKP